jgi:hypothetical protein
MKGKIYFEDAEGLAKFLTEFTGSTAIFTVHQIGYTFVLEFTGGY